MSITRSVAGVVVTVCCLSVTGVSDAQPDGEVIGTTAVSFSPCSQTAFGKGVRWSTRLSSQTTPIAQGSPSFLSETSVFGFNPKPSPFFSRLA